MHGEYRRRELQHITFQSVPLRFQMAKPINLRPTITPSVKWSRRRPCLAIAGIVRDDPDVRGAPKGDVVPSPPEGATSEV